MAGTLIAVLLFLFSIAVMVWFFRHRK
jgi:cbb3-type cytochrome oxidase subunit 3